VLFFNCEELRGAFYRTHSLMSKADKFSAVKQKDAEQK